MQSWIGSALYGCKCTCHVSLYMYHLNVFIFKLTLHWGFFSIIIKASNQSAQHEQFLGQYNLFSQNNSIRKTSYNKTDASFCNFTDFKFKELSCCNFRIYSHQVKFNSYNTPVDWYKLKISNNVGHVWFLISQGFELTLFGMSLLSTCCVSGKSCCFEWILIIIF